MEPSIGEQHSLNNQNIKASDIYKISEQICCIQQDQNAIKVQLEYNNKFFVGVIEFIKKLQDDIAELKEEVEVLKSNEGFITGPCENILPLLPSISDDSDDSDDSD